MTHLEVPFDYKGIFKNATVQLEQSGSSLSWCSFRALDILAEPTLPAGVQYQYSRCLAV